MGDDATVEILLKVKEENFAAFTELTGQLDKLVAQAMVTNLILRSTAAVTTDVQNATQAASAAGTAGIPVWLGVAAAVAASVAVLWPFVMLIGSAAIAMVSFTVGAAGFLAIGALVAGTFAAIGAGVLLLGGGGGVGSAAALDKTTIALANAKSALVEFDTIHKGALTTAQSFQREQLVENQAKAQANYADALTRSQGPVGVLLAQFSQMKQTLADQAQPLAALITQWVGGAIPAVTQLGQSLMAWFGDRLPPVLAGISKIIKDLGPDFQAFGQYFGGVMDKIGPMLAPITEAFARLALQGAKGLLDNLVRLADWFVKELPGLGPIVQQTLGKIGDFVQWVASNWATLTDHVVNKWAPTVANAMIALDQLQKWWKVNGDTIKVFVGHVIDLLGNLNSVIKTWTDIYNFLDAHGLAPTTLLDAFNAIVDALSKIGGLVQSITGTKVTPGGSSAYDSARTNAPPPPLQGQGGNYSVNNYIYGQQDAEGLARGAARALARLVASN